MEQGEHMKVMALREKFQNDEPSKTRIKPAIPEKPKTIPPVSPTAKISNPLIASMSSAMGNRLAPRVVFKGDKKPSQPEPSLIKAKPILLDKNQKKEADLIKQALKDKMILPVSPVTTPVLEQTPKPESIQKSPALETPVKVSTPLKKFTFSKTDKDEKEKTPLSEWDVPPSPILDLSDSCISPVVPKALVPAVKANPTISAQAISPQPVRVSKPPALTLPELKTPLPVSQNGPLIEKPKSEIPVRLNSNVKSPTANILPHGLPEEATPILGIPDILDMNIPPPVIPEDFSDGGTSDLDISTNATYASSFPGVSLSVTPISSSPALSHRASPMVATETPDSPAVFVFSPLPAHLAPSLNDEPMAENRRTDSYKGFDHIEPPLASSPMAVSVVSALARAEEMSPVKHSSCDQRLLTLLEKAKRKSTASSQSSTADILPVIETEFPNDAPLESLLPEAAHVDPFFHSDAPNAPETLANLPDIPSVDYQDKAEEAAPTEYNTQPSETALSDQDHKKSSPPPKMVMVQRPVVPPPPPPRKPQLTLPNGGLTPEKPPQSTRTDVQSTILPSQPLVQSPTQHINHSSVNGIIIPAPADFTSEHETSKILDPSDITGSQAQAPDYGILGPSVHTETFLEHVNQEHQTPYTDTTDGGLPMTATTEPPDSVPTSPLGMQLNNSGIEWEDQGAIKKNKTSKKQRKGSPMNPYAETSVVTEEIPKKPLFSKKNSVSDEKELKQKEKQKQKDKEKEKEKEKKELKEKEKKELKEKEKEREQREKEKKELKEKEKEKKEQKDKKKEQKELGLREKERDKKELKEKEREKKEQKEKEKKENEMRKKFRITGEEEALYQAKVTETTKGRKDDLAVKAGEIISIIRTTDCPKGKWLARDSTNKYGYIPVESVQSDMQDMLVLGNKAKANRSSINGTLDPETPSTDILTSDHLYNQESFEEDSEEWGDEDDTVFPPAHTAYLEPKQTVASPNRGPDPVPAHPLAAHTDRSDNTDAGQEAIHRLSTFFAQPKVPTNLQNNRPIKEPGLLPVSAAEPGISPLKQEMDLQILPPPDLYADIITG